MLRECYYKASSILNSSIIAVYLLQRKYLHRVT